MANVFGKMGKDGTKCAFCDNSIPEGADYWLAVMDSMPNAVVCSDTCKTKMESEDKVEIKSGKRKSRGIFAHDLDAGRALLDATGFGLVGDAIGGAAKLIGGISAMKQKAAAKQDKKMSKLLDSLEKVSFDNKDRINSSLSSLYDSFSKADDADKANISLRAAVSTTIISLFTEGLGLYLNSQDAQQEDIKMHLKHMHYMKKTLPEVSIESTSRWYYNECNWAQITSVIMDGGSELLIEGLDSVSNLLSEVKLGLLDSKKDETAMNKMAMLESSVGTLEKGIAILKNDPGVKPEKIKKYEDKMEAFSKEKEKFQLTEDGLAKARNIRYAMESQIIDIPRLKEMTSRQAAEPSGENTDSDQPKKTSPASEITDVFKKNLGKGFGGLFGKK